MNPIDKDTGEYGWRVEKCTRCGALSLETEMINGLCRTCAEDTGEI